MNIKRRSRILSAGKSPSIEAMRRTYRRAELNGSVTVDFTNNIENIRELCRKLNYTDGNIFFKDAPFVYVPSSYGESKNFAQVQNKRNLLQWSEDFTQGVWLKNDISISANTNTNPFGVNKSYYINTSATTALHFLSTQTVTVIIGSYFTTTYYIKKADVSWVQILTAGGFDPNTWVNFNFDTGLFGNNGGAGSWTAKQLINGYWALSLKSLCTSSGLPSSGIIAGTNNIDTAVRAPSYSGTSGVKICDIAAIQLEQSAYVTPYQKTVAAGDGIVDFNFTRATSSTVTNKLGIIEDSCYNLLQRSEEFDNAAWVKFNTSVTPNAISNPQNGQLTADKVLETATSNAHQIYQQYVNATAATTVYTVSGYVKAAGRTETIFLVANSSISFSDINYINLTNGTVISGATPVIIKDVGNGWYYVEKRYTSPTIGITVAFGPSVSGSTTYLGNGVDGIYTWGVQAVLGSTPRPYLRTTNRLNVPKLDYSRSLLEPSLLIEPQRTNLVLQSEDLNNVSYTRLNTTASVNSTLSPDNTQSADKIIATTTNGEHRNYQVFSSSPIGTYTASAYIKKGDYDYAALMLKDNNLGPSATKYVILNLNTGVIASTTAAGQGFSSITGNVQSLPNGYYRLSITGVTTAIINIGANISIVDNTMAVQFAGDNVSGTYFWGFQFEAGSNATTYIPTTTATVTRNAENSYVDLWNNALLNKNNFTLYYEGFLYDGQTTGISFCLSDTNTAAANTNQIGFYNLNTPFFNIANVRTNGPSNATNNSLNKFAIQYSNGTVNFYRNGVNIWANQTVAVFDYRYLILNSGGSTYATDKICLFNRTLTNPEMISLTT